jgi:hypothetical protein
VSTPADQTSGINRRQAVLTVAAASLTIAAHGVGGQGTLLGATLPRSNFRSRDKTFWPDGARLAISLSLMFEGGGQPEFGAGGVIPEKIAEGIPDLPTNAFFAYGYNEGIPACST